MLMLGKVPEWCAGPAGKGERSEGSQNKAKEKNKGRRNLRNGSSHEFLDEGQSLFPTGYMRYYDKMESRGTSYDGSAQYGNSLFQSQSVVVSE